MFTTAFIILCIVEMIFILGCLAFERVAPAFLSFIICLLVAHFGLDVDIVKPIVADIPLALGMFGGYLLTGALYSVFRWYFRVRRVAAKISRQREKLASTYESLKAQALKAIETLTSSEWANEDEFVAAINDTWVDSSGSSSIALHRITNRPRGRWFGNKNGALDLDEAALRKIVGMDDYKMRTLVSKLNPRQNKAAITGWITFWPLDILILLFEEPIQALYEWLASTYHRISKAALAKAGAEDLIEEIDT